MEPAQRTPEEETTVPPSGEEQTFALRPGQWAGALAALAVMVFLITFVKNYLGDNTPPPPAPPAADLLRLEFASTRFPEDFPEKGPPLECELHRPSSHDFWFVNENDRPVRVGIYRKSCRCASVGLYVLSPQGRARLLTAGAASFGSSGRPLDLLALCAAQGEAVRTLREAVEPTPLETGDEAIVPPGAVGWVRVGWTGEQKRVQRFSADLWMDQKDVGPPLTLEVTVLFLNPLQLPRGKEVQFGTVNATDLPREASVLCWSPTRVNFRIEARAAPVAGRQPASDPFVVGSPVQLTLAECRRLEGTLSETRVLFGYRIPITLRPLSRDGTTPFELGPFQRVVVLTSPDDGIEPEEVTVTGRVEGEVTVTASAGEGVLRFGTFNRSKGSRRLTTTLESDVPGLRLEVDRARTPEYLRVHLPGPEVSPSGHRTWYLQAQVAPNQARGIFPRQDDPTYRDSAIYVHTVGPTPRSIRIPVSGVADDR